MSGAGGDHENAVVTARHEVAHAIASPARGTAIVADLLAEALEASELDVALLRDLSSTLTANVEDLQRRLEAFREGQDA